MEKLCVTHREYKVILDDLRKETDILSEGTDVIIEECRQKHFYFIKFRQFENFPSFIGKLHEQYGRLIDVRVLYTDTAGVLELSIRGLRKELR